MNWQIALLYWILFIICWLVHLYNKRPEVVYKDCTCGQEEDKCTSPITYHYNGHASRDPKEMVQCGKVKGQMEELERIFNKQNKSEDTHD